MKAGGDGGGAAAATSGLINLMVSEDSEGLSEDGGGKGGSASL